MAMSRRVQRVLAIVGAVAPVAGITPGPAGSWTLTYAAEATPAQVAAGDAALAQIDWSPAAEAAWQLSHDRDTAQGRWDAPSERLLRAVALVILDEINTLRQQHGLPARTAAQLRTAIRQRITTGGAD